MKQATLVAVLVGVLMVPSGRGEGPRTVPGPRSSRRSIVPAGEWGGPAADLAARRKLQVKIALLRFEDTPFKDAITFLRDVSGLNVQVRWKALAAAGIDKTTAQNLHLTDITAEKALRVILDDLGAAGTPLRYVIEDGGIIISTQQDFLRNQVTRVYDVSDLIAESQRRGGYGLRRIEIASDAAAFGGLRVMEDQEQRGTLTRAQIVENLIGSIVHTVAPTSWKQAGGPAQIRQRNGRLLVTQSPYNHRHVGRAIGELRGCSRLRISLEFWLVGVSEEGHAKLQKWLVGPLKKHRKRGDPSAKVAWDWYEGTGWVSGLCLDSKDFRAFRKVARRVPGAMVCSLPTLAWRNGERFQLSWRGGTRAKPAGPRGGASGRYIWPLFDGEASVTPSRRYVMLSLQHPWRCGRMIGMGQQPRIQLPTVTTSDLRPTVSVPDGGVLLLVEDGVESMPRSGGTLDEAGGPTGRELALLLQQDTVYVLVSAKIVAPRRPGGDPARGARPRESETAVTGRR